MSTNALQIGTVTTGSNTANKVISTFGSPDSKNIKLTTPSSSSVSTQNNISSTTTISGLPFTSSSAAKGITCVGTSLGVNNISKPFCSASKALDGVSNNNNNFELNRLSNIT